MSRTRTSLARRLQLECLEDRAVPAGAVTAALDGDTLTVTGDSAGNQILIAPDPLNPEQIRVTGLFFTRVNGARSATFDAAAVANVTTDLGGGSDAVTVAGIALTGDLSVTSGAGFDAVALYGVAADGSVSIDTGDGWDSVALLDVSAGSLDVQTGAGWDAVALTQVSAGSLSVDTGDGYDAVVAYQVTVADESAVVSGGAQTDLFIDLGSNTGFTTEEFEREIGL
ncbi:MAG TPA: hypothetical protein VIL46_04625 [Gemmataceae bacterium]